MYAKAGGLSPMAKHLKPTHPASAPERSAQALEALRKSLHGTEYVPLAQHVAILKTIPTGKHGDPRLNGALIRNTRARRNYYMTGA